MDPLRVMSFNLRYGTARDGKNRWDLRKDAVVAAIIKFDPDLLGIQEGLLFQLEFLKTRLEGYEYTGVGRDDGQQAGEFAAIFHKSLTLELLHSGTFWYSDTPSRPSRTWGNHCLRICTYAQFRVPVAGRTFFIFNTHFDLKAKVREKSAYLLQQKIHELSRGEPVIVTGDFNCNPTSKPYEILASAGLRDSFAARLTHVPHNVATCHNWKGKRSSRLPWRISTRIDWILHSPHFEALAHDILLEPTAGRYPSDHFPIVANLRWANG